MKTGSVSLSNVSSQHEDDPTRRCGIQVRLLNGETVVEEKYIPVNEACREWQFLSGSIQADGAYTKVEYAFVYDYNNNTSYFDGAQLFR